MKNIKNFLIIGFVLSLVLTGCEGAYDFGKEQYPGRAANLVSDNANLYDRKVFDMDYTQDTLYLTIGLGGTTPADKDVTIKIMAHDSLFNAYNKSNYDIDKSKFAKLLPASMVTVPSYDLVIPKGKSQGILPVYLKDFNILSPDSIYFLDYKIKEITNFALNDKKSETLYRINWKNRWANTEQPPVYQVFAYRWTENQKDTSRLSASPKMYPLAKNKVRVTVAATKFDTQENRDKNSLAIEVKADNKLSISGYKTLEVEQIDGDPEYNNTYKNEKIVAPGGAEIYYKTFRMYIKYRVKSTDKWSILKERLRLQYNPNLEN